MNEALKKSLDIDKHVEKKDVPHKEPRKKMIKKPQKNLDSINAHSDTSSIQRMQHKLQEVCSPSSSKAGEEYDAEQDDDLAIEDS